MVEAVLNKASMVLKLSFIWKALGDVLPMSTSLAKVDVAEVKSNEEVPIKVPAPLNHAACPVDPVKREEVATEVGVQAAPPLHPSTLLALTLANNTWLAFEVIPPAKLKIEEVANWLGNVLPLVALASIEFALMLARPRVPVVVIVPPVNPLFVPTEVTAVVRKVDVQPPKAPTAESVVGAWFAAQGLLEPPYAVS